MSDTSATIDRLLEKSHELKNGPERIVILEEAVALADQHEDADAGFKARLELMDAATFSGRPDLLLAAFSWCLGKHDGDPDRFDQRDLLWKYKWVMGHAVDFPDVPRSQIQTMLQDMANRFRKAGSTLHAVHQARGEILADMGYLAAADKAAQDLAKVKRDWLSDCRACVVDVTAGRFAAEKRDKEAVEAAQPILSGRVKCTHVPHRTYGKLLLPLLRLGRLDEAADCHRKGVRLIGDNPEFLGSATKHLEFVVLTGNLDQASGIVETYLPYAVVAPSLQTRMAFYRAVLLLLETLLDRGSDVLRTRLPAEIPVAPVGGGYDVVELLDWFSRQLDSLTKQFDARNGNDYYARWLDDLTEIKKSAVDVLLDAEPDPDDEE